MFGIGWGETIILLAAALIFLGPERLPGAIAWTLRTVREVKDYAVGAADQVRAEFGTEVEELAKPLADLNRIRGAGAGGFLAEYLLGEPKSPPVFSYPEPTPNFGIMGDIPDVDDTAAPPEDRHVEPESE